MAHASRPPHSRRPSTRPNPADKPPVSFDHLVHTLVEELGLSIHGVTDIAGVRFQVEEKLKWWHVFKHLFIAQYFPLTPEAAECSPTRGFAMNRFRVAHAIATRACRRYGPRHGILKGLEFVGPFAYRETPVAEPVMADLWIDPRRALVLLVIPDMRIELPFSIKRSSVVCSARDRYLRQDVSHQPIVLHGPWEPVRRTSGEWCAELQVAADAILKFGWYADSPLGFLPWDARIAQVEFEMRWRITQQLAGELLG